MNDNLCGKILVRKFMIWVRELLCLGNAVMDT